MKGINQWSFWFIIVAIPLQSCLLSGEAPEGNIILSGIVQEGPSFTPKPNVNVEINDSISARTDSRGVYNARIKVGDLEFSDYENKMFKLKLKLEKDTVLDLTIQVIDTTFDDGSRPVKKHFWFDYVNLK